MRHFKRLADVVSFSQVTCQNASVKEKWLEALRNQMEEIKSTLGSRNATCTATATCFSESNAHCSALAGAGHQLIPAKEFEAQIKKEKKAPPPAGGASGHAAAAHTSHVASAPAGPPRPLVSARTTRNAL